MSKTRSTVKLKGKDLITIGIFSAIYFVISLACNILGGIHAIVWFLTPAIAALICGIPFMIMTSKVKKPFAVLIMGIVVGLIYFATGQFHVAVPIAFVGASLIAEFIRCLSKYNSFWADAIGFAVFSLGMAASPLPLWIDSKAFIAQIKSFGMPQSYVNTVTSLTSPSMLVGMIVTTLVCALCGALFAKAMFKKHFKKAGIIA